MEQIVKMYGRFVLEGLAIVLLTGFLFYSVTDTEGHRGLLQIAGANLPTPNEEYNSYIDFKEVYQAESAKSAPEIKYVGSFVVVGNNRLNEIIKAVDYNGRELEIEVLSIKSADETELIEDYNAETSEIYLPQAGAYVVVVKATDDGNRTTQCVIKIPINGNLEQGETE